MKRAALGLFMAAAAVALTGPALAKPKPAPTPPETAYADLQWRLIGPFRGGWSTMVEGVPSKPDTFYFGAAGGGIWRTDDAGETWKPLFQNGPVAVIGALAIAPSNPDILYVGTGQPEARYDTQGGFGIYRSADGGQTWASAGLKDSRHIGKIWVSPTNPDTVLVGAVGHLFGTAGERGVYRTTDGGKTWTRTLDLGDDAGVTDIAADPTDPNILYAAAWQARQWPWQSYFTPIKGPKTALYRSGDGGLTWTRLKGEGWPTANLGRIGLAVTYTAQGTRVYASLDAPGASGIYRSDDGGGRWTRVNDMTAVLSHYFSRLTVDPTNPDVLYTVGQSIRRCVDGGKTCTIIRGSPGGDDYHYVWVNPAHPDHIAAASDQGTVVSVNGGVTWSSWYNQPTAQLYHLETDNRFPYWIYAGQQDSGTVGITSRSDYGAISFRDWIPVGGDERDYDVPDPNNPDIVYGSGLGGRVSKWDRVTGQIANVSPWPVSSYGRRPSIVKHHYNWITTLVASRTGPTVLYLGAEQILASRDQGQTWSAISPDLVGKREGAAGCDGDATLPDAFACGFGTVTAITPSSRHADEIWVGSDSGLVHLTRDAGKTWTDVTPPGLPQWTKIATLDLGPQDGTAYAAVDGQRIDDWQPHAYVTHDYGKTWTEISNGLPRDHFVSVVRADPVKPGLLYAGTDAAAFVSFDDGGHWQSLQHNLPTVWVRDLTVHGNDLIAGTQGRAIWALDDISPLRELTPETAAQPAHLFKPAQAWRVHANNNHDTPLPAETPLGENPPAGAVIDYWLGDPARQKVEIEIRDPSGALVRRLSSAEVEARPDAETYFAATWIRPAKPLSREAGHHRVVWDLHYPRPAAISYSYAIGAIQGRDTPITPEGPLALPGEYQVILRVDGKEQRQPLVLKEDPRINVSQADLAASLALSTEIGATLERVRIGYGETESVREQLEKLAKDIPNHPKAAGLAERVAALITKLTPPEVDRGPRLDEVDGALTSIESDLESVDRAPTQGQRDAVADYTSQGDGVLAAWKNTRDGDLVALNRDLKRAGLKPVVIPKPADMKVEAPDGGEEMP